MVTSIFRDGIEVVLRCAVGRWRFIKWGVVVVEFRSILAALAASLAVVGCQSKYEESSPDEVKIAGLPLQTRMDQKSKIDVRIEEIQRAAKKAKTVIEAFRKVQNSESGKDAYTPVDFLIDMGRELQTQLPEGTASGQLIRRASVKIPLSGVSEECRMVGVLLESDTLFDETDGGKAVIGEKLTYSIKTCRSQGQYRPVVEAGWRGSNLEFRLINDGLDSIFKDLLEDLGKNSSCRMLQDQEGALKSVSCENLMISLSQTKRAMIKTLAFYNIGDVRFELSADLFENGVKTAEPLFKVMSDGRPVGNDGLLPAVQPPVQK